MVKYYTKNDFAEKVLPCVCLCIDPLSWNSLIHHCVVIFFWSSGIIECMLYTFEKRVLLMRKGASVVWLLSLPRMNSFNKTEAAIFPCRLNFLKVFPFIGLIYNRYIQLLEVTHQTSVQSFRVWFPAPTSIFMFAFLFSCCVFYIFLKTLFLMKFWNTFWDVNSFLMQTLWPIIRTSRYRHGSFKRRFTRVYQC